LAKESGVMAVPLLALWASWRGLVPSARGVVIGGVGLAITSAGVLWTLYHPIQVDLAYTGTELTKVYALLGRIVVPIGFAIDHDWRGITPAVVAASLAGTITLVSLALWRRQPVWALAVVWVALCLAPRLSTPLLEGLHEHHLYLPNVGIALLVGHVLGGSRGVSETSA
jgi:hypothetical protein